MRPGFTLMEVLICLAIVSILSSITFVVVHKARSYAEMSNEVSAGRRLSAAYQLYAQDNNGKFMTGLDQRVRSVMFRDYQVDFMEAPRRYVFRLAPYLNYELDGSVFVNGNKEQIVDYYGSSGDIYDYIVSLLPAMGMNMSFVGGKIGTGGRWTDEDMETETITRQSQMEKPILVFASGGMDAAGLNLDGDFKGYFELKPPYTWSGFDWKEGNAPVDYGNVAFRHDGKAVCAFLDGSVQALTCEELRDMRLWSTQAALKNDPNYQADLY